MATKLVNLNEAGIDVSSAEHVVAVPEDRAKESVRTFQFHKKSAPLGKMVERVRGGYDCNGIDRCLLV